MYSNILLPVAYEPGTQLQAPLAVAHALASEGAKLTLVHVMEILPTYVVEYLPPKTLDITRSEILGKMVEVAADLPNAEVQVLDGHPGRALSDYAKSEEIDLIVMASHIPGAGDMRSRNACQ